MVNQNKYFNKIHEHERFYECLVCRETIFNPLCPMCIAEQIQVWLTSYPDLSRKLKPIIRKYLRDLHNEISHLDIECVACKEKRAAVCPYCFTEYVLFQLKKLQVNRQILGEFLRFFNFDLDYSGYAKEAEKIGLL